MLDLSAITDLDVGEEAIKFQPMSTLGQGLDALWTEVFEFRAKEYADGNDKKGTSAEVLKYFTNTIIPKIKKLVKDETGIEVVSIVPNMSGSGMIMCQGDFDSTGKGGKLLWYESLQRIGNGKHDIYTPDMSEKQIVKVLSEIGTLIDKSSGKVKDTSVKVEDMLYGLSFVIHFDVAATFLITEQVSTEIVPLEAGEITAILLHEIGHFITAVEHAADIVRLQHGVVDLMKTDQVRKGDLSSKMKILRAMGSVVDIAAKREDKDIAKELKLISSSIDTVVKVPNESTVIGKFGAVVYTMLLSVFGIAASVLLSIPMLLLGTLGGLYTRKSLESGWGIKLSEFGTVKGQKAASERVADIYATRHGYGGHLATGLSKIWACGLSKSLSTAAMIESKYLFYYNTTIATGIFTAVGMDSTGLGVYDTFVERTNRILMSVLPVFKQPGLPPELQDMYIAQYESTKKRIDQAMSEQKYRVRLMDRAMIIRNTLSVPALIQLLFQGNSDKHYTTLMDAVERMNSSRLFYGAAKVDQLGRRR